MKNWIVPMIITYSGTVYVEAETEEEAKRLAERGEWTEWDDDEIHDWDVDGDPEEDI